MDCLRGYNIKQTKYSFIQALAIINRTRVIRYAGKFVSRNNSFSNGMVHLDQDVNIDHLPEFGQNEMFQLSNVLDRNEKVKAINRQLTNEVKNVRMIIGLKSRGYSNNEIGQRLSLTPKRVANYFSMFVKRFRILHPQLIDE
ncbi:hypothetical protein FACS1894218_2260 [Bacilli bacterium]|nr:hypothetical protein FACS1894218_2260 [Bacilli bacterium]